MIHGTMARQLTVALCGGLICVASTGCGYKPKLPPMAEVSGQVTLDGKPLPRGTVQFVPDTAPDYVGTESSRGVNLHSAVFYFYYTPNRNHGSAWRARSFHPGGVHMVFADGSVHFVTDTIELKTFQSLATIAGGEVIDGSKMP